MTDPADAIEQRFADATSGLVRTGVVTGTSGTQLVVTVAGTAMTLPRLVTYTPTVGHVVIILAAPGAWLVLGRVA
ncbi:hypothetical protein [Actinoalloteichus sp. GBA129-24]|uniref:hypothetical protein n=1 Tax=Actinoalloteichus sp. GBA129-24 TaxID=1612551 RepID=UPI000950737D|nr:hypothetical protein [Actinoalloteichus sp. GBA129-24]APU20957.1 hypothetical protein UA75_14735 [Actinoalloteichus sp. GBA129-24]APU24206.1 hypothetical protein UA75_31215 [Actinoalloteichus sp. GBA129-24]